MMRRVLVTGGRGYLGRRVEQSLAAAGWEVRTGSRDPQTATGAHSIVFTDYASPRSLLEACRGCDAVLHLAGPGHAACAADPEEALIGHARNTLRLVDAAVATGVRRLIRFSTSHVYGLQVGHVDEDTPTRPQHPYGAAHRSAEDWVRITHYAGHLTGIVVRLANAVGCPVEPLPSPLPLVNDLCRQAVETARLELRSDGRAWRNFVALSDVERLVLHLLSLDEAAAAPGLFNAGGARSMPIRDMAGLVADRCERVLGIRPPISASPASGVAQPAFSYGTDRVRTTGFAFADDLESEIDETLRASLSWYGPPSAEAR